MEWWNGDRSRTTRHEMSETTHGKESATEKISQQLARNCHIWVRNLGVSLPSSPPFSYRNPGLATFLFILSSSLFIAVIFRGDKVLCVTVWPQIHYVNVADCELLNLCNFSRVQGLQACNITPNLWECLGYNYDLRKDRKGLFQISYIPALALLWTTVVTQKLEDMK